MNIYIIRHGETEDNKRNICQGQTHGALTELGKQQALEVANKIRFEQIHAIFSSDLHRAKQTTEIIFGSRKDVEITFDKRLRERHFGALQGKQLTTISDYCKEMDDAETIANLRARVNEFLLSIKKEYDNKNVALVSHGITIKMICSICSGEKFEDINLAKNCEVIRIKF